MVKTGGLLSLQPGSSPVTPGNTGGLLGPQGPVGPGGGSGGKASGPDLTGVAPGLDPAIAGWDPSAFGWTQNPDGSWAPPGNAATDLAASNAAATISGANQNLLQGQQQLAQQSAMDVFLQMLQGAPPDLINALMPEAQQIITSTDSAQQAYMQIQQTQAFKDYFPGIQQAINNGYAPPTPAQYLNYQAQAQQMARAAGVPPDMMGKDEIATLIGNNVSVNELSDRINTAYMNATNGDPGTLTYLEQNFGLTPGNGLASYFLDPTKAVPTLEKQVSEATIAGAGEAAGFSPISLDQATQIAQTMDWTNPAAVRQAAAAGFKNIAALTPLTTGLPGQNAGPGTVSQAQLVGSQFLGDQADVRAVELAQGTRKAAFSAGGGFGQTTRGAGVGYGSEQGTQGQQPY